MIFVLGAILSGSWNHDGTEILTSGEDGSIRIWSRAGMLRSTIASCPVPIYASCWSPDGQSVAHTLGQNITIKSTTPSVKPVEWKAHEGIILCLSWNVASDLLISGSEDCKYKVWDSSGNPIFSSGVQPNPISSIGWAPAGDLFAVGSFNSLRLCDCYGVRDRKYENRFLNYEFQIYKNKYIFANENLKQQDDTISNRFPKTLSNLDENEESYSNFTVFIMAYKNGVSCSYNEQHGV